MTTRLLAALIVAGLATSSAAQTPPVALDVFLEQRVAEELAADGTLLSRLGVALDVEIVGDKTLVSLVDPATRRAIASTKLDTLPADREAAVATVVQIVSNLTSQLSQTTSTAVAMKSALEDERKHRERKELAEAAYYRDAIHFGDHSTVRSYGSIVTTQLQSVPYRGDRRLTPLEMFELTDRQDLVERYRDRHRVGVGTLLASLGSFCVGGYLVFSGDLESSSPTRRQKIGLGFWGAGFIFGFVGIYYIARSNPLSEGEMHDVAEAYNGKLRVKHGLPALSARPKRIQDVSLVPYADDNGGGFALTGRF
jgi:hypothetical protein